MSAPARPEGLPEKFATVADLVKSYGELETKLGAAKPEPTKDEKTATDALAVAGVDEDVIAKEVSESGKLSDTTLKLLESRGITASMASSIVRGIQAEAQSVRSEFTKLVGGEDQFKAMSDWAEANLPADQKEAYNEALKTGNKATAQLLLTGIHAQYVSATGQDPKLVSAGLLPTGSGAKPFGSTSEMVEAMRSPKYANDPAYREEVYKRVAASQNANYNASTRTVTFG